MALNDKTNEVCPLCASTNGYLFSEDKNRIYIRCDACSLIFVPGRFFLSPEKEKARYCCHNNSPEDKGYTQFLYRLINPLLKTLDKNCYGLDFGSGPTPVLASLLEKEGHTVETYDIFYDNRPELLQNKYDFITVCEVIEHLHRPMDELTTLFQALKKDGLLAIMTQPAVPAERFPGWRYKNDPTHVLFFSEKTFYFITDLFECGYFNPDYGVFFMKKGKRL